MIRSEKRKKLLKMLAQELHMGIWNTKDRKKAQNKVMRVM